MRTETDFTVIGEGTVFLLHPESEDAEAWIESNIPVDSFRLNKAVAVEHRYIGDILQGVVDDGLTVRRVA